jgi:hypothetical protein
MKALVFVTATYAIFRIGDTWPADGTGSTGQRWVIRLFMLLIFGGCVAGMAG